MCEKLPGESSWKFNTLMLSIKKMLSLGTRDCFACLANILRFLQTKYFLMVKTILISLLRNWILFSLNCSYFYLPIILQDMLWCKSCGININCNLLNFGNIFYEQKWILLFLVSSTRFCSGLHGYNGMRKQYIISYPG